MAFGEETHLLAGKPASSATRLRAAVVGVLTVAAAIAYVALLSTSTKEEIAHDSKITDEPKIEMPGEVGTILESGAWSVEQAGLDGFGDLAHMIARTDTLTDTGKTEIVTDAPGGSGCSSTQQCSECHGDCDDDSQCATGLACFQRSAEEPVPGCTGAGRNTYDYCYYTGGPNELTTVPPNSSSCSSAAPCAACHGDCDSDSQCRGDLQCFQRDGTDPVPGCTGVGDNTYDYCYSANSLIDVEPGSSGCTSSAPCPVCSGDCDSDSQCEGGATCFQRDGYEAVPGCRGQGHTTWDYCVAPETGADVLVDVPPSSSGCTRTAPCPECRGDCDSDRDCQSNLYCFQRDGTEAVPGCTGTGHNTWDYCMAPAQPTINLNRGEPGPEGLVAYQFYKFDLISVREGITVQITELDMYGRNGNRIVPVTATAVEPSRSPSGEQPTAAINGLANLVRCRGNCDHKWLDFEGADLIVHFAAPTAITSYDWMTANDGPARDPIMWTLQGSSTETGPWTDIDTTYQSQPFTTPFDADVATGMHACTAWGCSRRGELRYTWVGPFLLSASAAVPQDCQGAWGDWTGCTTTCGPGFSTRDYIVTEPAAHGGTACPSPAVETGTQSCPNNLPCAVDCVGYWGPFANCSASCGNGTKSREYLVTTPAEGTGTPCPGNSETDTTSIEDMLPFPHTIVWDDNQNGQIRDGGNDMYDRGNKITTNLCNTHLQPWTDNMEEVSSDCFGAGGSYKMSLRSSMMVLLSRNTGSASMTISIGGNLGADGGGTHRRETFRQGDMVGYMTNVCAADGDPSISHLFVIDESLSPNVHHTVNPYTNSDFDEVSGIGPGSTVLYLMYAGESGHCRTIAEHREVFTAAVSAVSAAGVQSEECASGVPCAVDCVGEYGPWGACTATCGNGTRTRDFVSAADALHGGAECPAPETEPCSNLPPCPLDCQGDWGPFSACSVTCGNGTRSRNFVETSPAQFGGAVCPGTEADEVGPIEAAVQNAYPISWDANDGGQIRDGGHDMYDRGNRITTNFCPSPDSDRLMPYTDDMEVVASDCFGPGGSYKMSLETSMMVLLSENTATRELTISISGNLGADGGGEHQAATFQSGSLRGYMTSVCSASGDPSVNHLFVIDSDMSPAVQHNVSPNTNSDMDEVSGIGQGSPVLYLLYASASGHCHSDGEHRAIFSAAVAALFSNAESSEDCHPAVCPVDCEGTWGEWSTCTATCGPGVRTREYTAIVDARHGGVNCPASPESQACNLGECITGQPGLLLEVWTNLYDREAAWTNADGRLVHTQPDLMTNSSNGSSTFSQQVQGSATEPVMSPAIPAAKAEPTAQLHTHSFEAPVDSVKDGAERLSGFFHVPFTGNYVFRLASDDAGRLYLNPTGRTDGPAIVIAEVGMFLGRPGYANGDSSVDSTREYMEGAGAGRERTASSRPIFLTAGTDCFISALEINRQGRDALSVAVTFPATTTGPPEDQPIPATWNGTRLLFSESVENLTTAVPNHLVGRGTDPIAANADVQVSMVSFSLAPHKVPATRRPVKPAHYHQLENDWMFSMAMPGAAVSSAEAAPVAPHATPVVAESSVPAPQVMPVAAVLDVGAGALVQTQLHTQPIAKEVITSDVDQLLKEMVGEAEEDAAIERAVQPVVTEKTETTQKRKMSGRGHGGRGHGGRGRKL